MEKKKNKINKILNKMFNKKLPKELITIIINYYYNININTYDMYPSYIII
tara:strand:- start:355 stop:504 length:150 start_codon:yes stop_codon:yes gene_type:complete